MVRRYRRFRRYGRRGYRSLRRATRFYRRHKRYGTGRVARATLTRSLAARMRRVMRNPFAMATNNPKIPDGKASLSAGQKFQHIQQVTTDANGEITIIIFPGLGAGALWEKDAASGVLAYANHGSVNVTPAAGQVNFITDLDDIAQWRIVSQGLQISLTNNNEENDGWYESVRLHVSREPSNFVMFETTAPQHVMIPLATTDGAFGVSSNTWIEHPTYTTGKLRDIHKVQFLLQHETNSYEFKRIINQGTVDFGTSVPTLADTASSRQFMQDRLDSTFDCVLIRIHGRDVGPASKLLMHLVSNQEIVYENGTTLSRFHTECVRG